MGLVDDAFGKRMMIVADRTDFPVGEKKFLRLQCVTTADDSPIDRYEELVVDAGVRGSREPARLGPAVKHHVLVFARLPEPLIKIRDRRFVLGAIGLNDDGHECASSEHS